MDVEWKHALPGVEGELLWGGGSFQFAQKPDLYTGFASLFPLISIPFSITPNIKYYSCQTLIHTITFFNHFHLK